MSEPKQDTNAEVKETGAAEETAKRLEIAAFDPLASQSEREAAEKAATSSGSFVMPETNAVDKLLAASQAAQEAEQAAYEEAKKKREDENALRLSDDDDPFKGL